MKLTKPAIIACSVSIFLVAGYALAEEAKKQGMVIVRPTDLKWRDAPPSLPAGIQMAQLEGDLTKVGPFTVRLKLPPGAKIAPHHHPGTEHVTVVEGTFWVGDGEKFDEKQLRDLEAGSFMMMEKGHRHFVMSKEGAVIQLHGQGPWGITYVNPSDDPARQARK